MASTKNNNFKVFNPSINNILRADRYNTEDITEAERKYIAKHAPKTRIGRMDLTPGNVVVVLEGAHTGKRVVFIKQLPECIAVVAGVSSINGVSAFRIDERYLLKLSAKVELPSGLDIDADSLPESKAYEAEKIEAEPSDSEKAVEKSLMAAITKVPFLKSYLAEPFKVDHDVEFYSQDY